MSIKSSPQVVAATQRRSTRFRAAPRTLARRAIEINRVNGYAVLGIGCLPMAYGFERLSQIAKLRGFIDQQNHAREGHVVQKQLSHIGITQNPTSV